MKAIVLFLLFFVASLSFGQQLTYKPINPNFGGNTFNYAWLLSSAEAQNSFTDPSEEKEEKSGIDEFSENLNRQLLGQISRTLLNAKLGDGLQEGSFVFGDLAIEVIESSEGLVINILDINTGEQTQIIVPN